MCNKNASILLEVILSILLLSLVSTSAILIYKDFLTIQYHEYTKELTNIELLNTKYFLQKNIHNSADLQQLKLKEKMLYFNKSLLLKEVDTFEIKTDSKIVLLTICIQKSRCKSFGLTL